MIQYVPYDDGLYDVGCDTCGEYEEFSAGTFNQLLEQMKQAGWRNRKVRDEWQHECPCCVEEALRKEFL